MRRVWVSRGRRPPRAMLAAALSIGSGLLVAPMVAEAATVPDCQSVAVSPDFRVDRTAMCARLAREEAGDLYVPRLFVTTDGGRSWRAAPTAGLVTDPTKPFAFVPKFSPLYADDGIIVLPTNKGLYATTDLGRTARLLDPLVLAGDVAQQQTVYAADASVGSVSVPASRRVFNLLAYDQFSARTDVATGAHQPVGGTGSPTTEAFLTPPVLQATDRPLAIGREDEIHDLQSFHSTVVVWGCTTEFVCLERLFSFPMDVGPAESVGANRFWLAPSTSAGFATVLALLAGTDRHSIQAWRSVDGGVTFARWASVDGMLAPFNRSGRGPQATLAMDPARPGEVYLRVHGRPPERGWRSATLPPAEQLFRSGDGGRSWKRVGFQQAPGQPGRKGNLPWNSTAGAPEPNQLVVAPDGRLFAIGTAYPTSGQASVYAGVWCSVDGGVHWARLCPR